MKIIIAGSGKVGFTLAEQLVRESHDVTIVDLKEAALRRAADMLDIMAVQGQRRVRQCAAGGRGGQRRPGWWPPPIPTR